MRCLNSCKRVGACLAMTFLNRNASWSSVTCRGTEKTQCLGGRPLLIGAVRANVEGRCLYQNTANFDAAVQSTGADAGGGFSGLAWLIRESSRCC